MSIARQFVKGGRDVAAIKRNAAAAGLRIEIQERHVSVWPEHWLPLQLVQKLDSQILYRPDGQMQGYRHEALGFWLDVMRVPPERRLEVADNFVELQGAIVAVSRGN
jgi:hypothetical protein